MILLSDIVIVPVINLPYIMLGAFTMAFFAWAYGQIMR